MACCYTLDGHKGHFRRERCAMLHACCAHVLLLYASAILGAGSSPGYLSRFRGQGHALTARLPLCKYRKFWRRWRATPQPFGRNT